MSPVAGHFGDKTHGDSAARLLWRHFLSPNGDNDKKPCRREWSGDSTFSPSSVAMSPPSKQHIIIYFSSYPHLFYSKIYQIAYYIVWIVYLPLVAFFFFFCEEVYVRSGKLFSHGAFLRTHWRNFQSNLRNKHEKQLIIILI